MRLQETKALAASRNRPEKVAVETSFNAGRLDGLKGRCHNTDIGEPAVDDGPYDRISKQSHGTPGCSRWKVSQWDAESQWREEFCSGSDDGQLADP